MIKPIEIETYFQFEITTHRKGVKENKKAI